MDKRFMVLLGIVVLGLGALFVFAGDKNDVTDTSTGGTGTVSNHSIGANSKNIEIIEYADFQCPACSAYFPVTKAIQEKYKNDIKWTFRHFPLEQLHQNARSSSRAAEAAGLQGKFFEMHDKLFENTEYWASMADARSIFQGYAKDLNLDMAKFDADYASETVNSTINADKAEGTSKGVTGTPTFFINGQKMSGEEIESFEAFSARIDEAIKSSSGN